MRPRRFSGRLTPDRSPAWRRFRLKRRTPIPRCRQRRAKMARLESGIDCRLLRRLSHSHNRSPTLVTSRDGKRLATSGLLNSRPAVVVPRSRIRFTHYHLAGARCTRASDAIQASMGKNWLPDRMTKQLVSGTSPMRSFLSWLASSTKWLLRLSR